jgi:UDP-N-acetylmuramoyl-L-alanyl-D-glutamate--2,6-diaminopimelate ligase
MEKYFAAKELLFRDLMKGGWTGAANLDDSYGARLVEHFPGRLIPFSLSGRAGALTARVLGESLAGTDLNVIYPDERQSLVRIPTLGRYNAENALLALAVAECLRISRETALAGLAAMPPVPGRMERYLMGHGVGCVIDYAHSPDGLDKVLSALRGACSGRLWAVFGHGGDRYAPSRPALGRIAAERADRIVITMDNPRSEDPARIAEQIREGASASGRATPCEIILDRGEAIRFALDRALPGDLVAVTGKGPERFILYGDHKIPFQDRRVLLDWASVRGVDVQ